MGGSHLPPEGGAFVLYPKVPVLGNPNGPLAGLRFAVKDTFEVRGYPTGNGNRTLTEHAPPSVRTAPAVQRMLDAGAIFVGKTVTDEFALSLDGRNLGVGTPLNPAAPDRLTGGSSSGSASAVADSSVDFAIGSDTAGSIRVPASQCGLYALRPTMGRISTDGMTPLAPSFDSCGLIARELSTLRRVCEVALEGPTASGPPPALFSLDVAWPDIGFTEDPARVAVEGLGRHIVHLTNEEMSSHVINEVCKRVLRVIGHEASSTLSSLSIDCAETISPATARHLSWAEAISSASYTTALSDIFAFRRWWQRLLGCHGYVIMPTVPTGVPGRFNSDEQLLARRKAVLPWLSLACALGCPQVTIPVGWLDGAPRGLSLLGPPGSDIDLLDFALQFSAINSLVPKHATQST